MLYFTPGVIVAAPLNAAQQSLGDLERRVADLERLLHIDQCIGSTLELQKVLNILLREALEITGCDRGDLRLLDAESDELVLVCSYGPMTHLEPTRVSAKEGISARALTGEIQLVLDVRADPDYTVLLSKYPQHTDYGRFLRSFVSTVKVPIPGPHKPIGVFCAHSSNRNEFSSCSLELLKELMRRASWAIGNAKAFESLEYKLSVRREIERAAAKSNNLQTLLDAVLENALARLHSDQGLIRLVDKPRNQLVLAASRNIAPRTIPLTVLLGAGVAGHVADEAKSIIVNDTRQHEGFMRRLIAYRGTRFADFLESIGSMVAAHFCASGEVVGVIAVHNRDTNAFRKENLEALCEIADQAAVPIRNAVQNETSRLASEMTKEFQRLLDFADEPGLLEELLEYAMRLTGCAAGHVYLLDPTEKCLQLSTSRNLERQFLPDQDVGLGINGRALRAGKAQIATNPHEDDPDFRAFLETLSPEGRRSFANLHTLAVVPIISGRNRYGVICLHSIDPITNPAVIGPSLEEFGSFAATLVKQSRLQRDKEDAKRVSREVRHELDRAQGYSAVVGRSPAIRQLLSMIDRVAATNATVLLLGETGTGKDLLARIIHGCSPRAQGPLVIVNCGAIPDTLLHSELFGHERGAFTNAYERRKGKFEQAHGGTLFLNEIGELPPEMQKSLLDVLQERTFERLGGSHTVHADFRVIAATHRNLAEDIRSGRFREDLWFRLNEVVLQVPPLRERSEDMNLLVTHLLARVNHRNGRNVSLHSDALPVLVQYSWPGNVRQLEKMLDRLVILSDTDVLDRQTVLDAIRKETVGPGSDPEQPANCRSVLISMKEAADSEPGGQRRLSLNDRRRIWERNEIEQALLATKGNMAAAARILKIDVSNLKRKIQKLGIDLAMFRSQT